MVGRAFLGNFLYSRRDDLPLFNQFSYSPLNLVISWFDFLMSSSDMCVFEIDPYKLTSFEPNGLSS